VLTIQTEIQSNHIGLALGRAGLSGLEVLQRIKAFNSRIPVIMLTGHGRPEDGPRGLQLGAFAYLIKPFDIDELMTSAEVIEKMIYAIAIEFV
jgi:DNA-binding response OmpR family regulator